MGVQGRVQSGKLFEQSLIKDGWIVKPKSPRLKWLGDGKSSFQKMKHCEYNPKLFKLDESSTVEKYDIIHPETNRYREVKKYMKKDLSTWTLYSEPFFKVATKSQQRQITTEVYNSFSKDFFNFHLKTGLFDEIVNNMTSYSEGIMVEDGFIPSKQLEFRTILVENNWAGYHRITIQFRLKHE